MLNFVGVFLSLKVAATIAEDIVDAGAITPTVVFAGLLGGIFWNLITWRLGLPSSSSHALIGGVVGAVLVAAAGAWLDGADPALRRDPSGRRLMIDWEALGQVVVYSFAAAVTVTVLFTAGVRVTAGEGRAPAVRFALAGTAFAASLALAVLGLYVMFTTNSAAVSGATAVLPLGAVVVARWLLLLLDRGGRRRLRRGGVVATCRE